MAQMGRDTPPGGARMLRAGVGRSCQGREGLWSPMPIYSHPGVDRIGGRKGV